MPLLFLAACSSSPAPVGKDTYMLSGTGAWSWSSGAAIKGDLYRQANDFCRSQGKQLMPAEARSTDGSFSNFAQAEVTFRCLSENDPEFGRPNVRGAPDMIIEKR